MRCLNCGANSIPLDTMICPKSSDDEQGAIADFTKAIELEPKFATAFNNRGNAKKALGNLQGAEADFQKVKKLSQ